MNPITILLADDHELVCEAFKEVLNQQNVFNVIAIAKNGQDAVTLALRHVPDVVLMDASMPIMNGFEATRQIIKALPPSKVIILSAYNESECGKQAVKSGAKGY